MTFGWCLTHRLEVVLEDSLGNTVFSEVDELILCMDYLYKKLLKKLWQLTELVNICKEINEFKAGGVHPKKASDLHLFSIVYIAVKNYLFNSEFSRHVHILITFLFDKVIAVLSSHIKQTSPCIYIKIRFYDRN